MSKEKAIISMTTWNRVEGTKKCLESIFEHTFGDYKVYITDNGSTDGTVDYLKSLSAYPVEVTYLRENVGISKARNTHWYKCIGNDVVRMDNDIVIETDDWFNILKDISYKYHAFVGIVPDSYKERIPKEKLENDLIFTDEIPNHQHNFFTVSGQLMFVPKMAIDSIGYWSEDYGLHAWEDVDYGSKAEAIGYSQIFTNMVKTLHLYPEKNVWDTMGHDYCIKMFSLLQQNVISFISKNKREARDVYGLRELNSRDLRYHAHVQNKGESERPIP